MLLRLSCSSMSISSMTLAMNCFGSTSSTISRLAAPTPTPLMAITNLINCQQTRAKCQAGRYKVTLKRNRPLTYEQANKPCYIGVRKAWNAWNTSSLVGVPHTAEVVLDDMFIRSFLHGTWHRLFLSEVILKRRANMVIITGVVGYQIPARRYYWLIGYTEEILSRILKCPVKVDIQTTPERTGLVYKYI